ncbi:MAG TPA: glycosyltransferase [Rhizomicrobium sp.]|nr:glycosyltransferase [Rhizomicrobium sp.]
MAEVAICIPTFRRPRSLERLLAAIEKLETRAAVTVIVADNDAATHEGHDLCRRIAPFYRWPLDSFVAGERGIAQARNALTERLLKTGAKFAAMLDDDEWPEPGWLDAFLKVQWDTGADALHGAVVPVFETRPRQSVAECDGMASQRGTTGPCAMIRSTANVLLTRACFEDMPKPCFDPAFGLSGGEDRDFFTRLKARGARFAYADEAVVNAFVPASRATLAWALKRAYRVGNSDMRVFLKYRPSARQFAGECVKIAGAFAAVPVMSVWLAARPARRAIGLWKGFRAAGKLMALFGHRYDEYSVIHGA